MLMSEVFSQQLNDLPMINSLQTVLSCSKFPGQMLHLFGVILEQSLA